MIAISACLMGVTCRYNGSSVSCSELEKVMSDKKVLLFCPEMMGGFSTPREPVEIVQGTGIDVMDQKAHVRDRFGNDVTEQMIYGATIANELIRKNNVLLVVLKDKSPSCGLHEIHDGRFSGEVINGCGILPAMLRDSKVTMCVEHEIELIKQTLNKLERVDRYE